jgi:hypothetical protein
MIQGMKFRAKDVAKYEREQKTNFAQLIGEVMSGVDSLADVIAIGLKTDKDRAFDIIQDELDTGIDLEDIQQDVLNALAKAGFMRGVISKIKVKELMEKQIAPLLEQMGVVEVGVQEEQNVQTEQAVEVEDEVL